MGLFDLNEYKQKKRRADESATPPRAFPIAFAEVQFGGRKQKLRLQPVLLDGAHVFVSFRPDDAPEEYDLIVGGGNKYSQFVEKPHVDDVPEALVMNMEEAFEKAKWLPHAIHAIENRHFGRLTVTEENEGHFLFRFFGSTGVVYEEDYITYLDGTMGRFFAESRADFNPSPDYDYWANAEDAHVLLARLNAHEFKAHLEREKALPLSVYGISLRWKQMSFAEKHALLPQLEKEVENEILPLMRAVVWSDPSIGLESSTRDANGRGQEKPFWRCPRFWVKTDDDKANIFHLDDYFERRIARLWPYIAAHFLPRFQHRQTTEVHPAVLHWMNYGGAYLIKFEVPNAHERLEARLLLRDFLLEKGVSLDEIDTELKQKFLSE